MGNWRGPADYRYNAPAARGSWAAGRRLGFNEWPCSAWHGSMPGNHAQVGLIRLFGGRSSAARTTFSLNAWSYVVRFFLPAPPVGAVGRMSDDTIRHDDEEGVRHPEMHFEVKIPPSSRARVLARLSPPPAQLVSTHGICTTTTRSGNQGHTHAPTLRRVSKYYYYLRPAASSPFIHP